MPAREAPVPPMREETRGIARGALRSDLDALLRNTRKDERGRDGAWEIEGGLSRRVGLQERGVELRGHFGTDGEAARVKARPDRRDDSRGRNPALPETLDRGGTDSVPRSAPSAMDERPGGSLLRDQRDRRAIRCGDADPGISGSDHEAVRVASALLGADDRSAVDLMQHRRPAVRNAGGVAQPAPVLAHGIVVVSHTEAQVERRVRARAHAAHSRGHSEPSRRGKPARRGMPEGNLRCFHARNSGGLARIAQALCVLLVAAGCAHAPGASSGGAAGAAARDRFLLSFAVAEPATRGAGMLSVHAGAYSRAGMNTRWASVRDSVAVVAYVGPVRALDAVLVGESVFVALRPYALALTGAVPKGEGLGGRGLRFLTRPWDFSPAWIRDAIERAKIEPMDEGGWRLTGQFEDAKVTHAFVLDLNDKSEPLRLRIQHDGDERSLALVRYGPMRRFDIGRRPQWVEWTRGTTRARLDIEEHERAKLTSIWHAPPPDADWTVLSLDDPRGRELLHRLLGVIDEVTP